MAFIGLLAIMLFTWGCSSDMSTSPDTSGADLTSAMNSSGAERVSVLVGFVKGNRPDAALKAAGGSILKEYRYVPAVYVSIPVAAAKTIPERENQDVSSRILACLTFTLRAFNSILTSGTLSISA